MDLGLRGKGAIVTGGSRGLGRAIALGLAEEGCNVALCGRNQETLLKAAREVEAKGVSALPVVADVTQPADIQRLVKETALAFGRIDILVNNVGRSLPGYEDESWEAAFQINVLPAVRASRLVIPHIRQAGGGSIVHIASVWGRESGGLPSYNAAKAALISHAKALARDLAPDSIRVNSVAPGSMSFPGGSWWRRQQEDPEGMAEFVRLNIPMGRFGTPEEIASVVVFLCSQRAGWVTGACINVDGGQSRSNI